MKKVSCWEIIFAAMFVAAFALVIVPPVLTELDRPDGVKLKNSAHEIWEAVVSANAERELQAKPLLWPGDLAESGIGAANAEEYFTCLMSDGSNTGVIARNPAQRVAAGLKPSMLAAPGVKALPGKESRVMPANNAWHVVKVGGAMRAETPFLVSRNVKASAIAYPEPGEIKHLKNGDTPGQPILMGPKTKPFGEHLAVWLTKDGATYEARPRLVLRACVVCVEKTEDAPELTVLPSQGGFQ